MASILRFGTTIANNVADVKNACTPTTERFIMVGFAALACRSKRLLYHNFEHAFDGDIAESSNSGASVTSTTSAPISMI
jgi:hypothetical protein